MTGYQPFAMWSTICVAFVSFLAAVLTVELIRRLNKWNGFLLLVASLTIAQGIYDVGFFFLPFYENEIAKHFYFFISTVGGLTATLWSNVLIIVIYEIVATLQSVNVMERYPYYFVIVVVPPVCLAIAFSLHENSLALGTIYLAIRSISICINIFIYGLVLIKIGKMRYSPVQSPLLSSADYGNSPTSYDIIMTLTKRLLYYCVVQTVTRIGATWYQLQWGFGSYNYDVDEPSTWQLIAIFTQVVLSPLAGVGYLLVFLYIQPSALSAFRSLIGCQGHHAAQASESQRTEEGGEHYIGNSESTKRSSLFSLADMDEEELAQELDRAYNLANGSGSIHSSLGATDSVARGTGTSTSNSVGTFATANWEPRWLAKQTENASNSGNSFSQNRHRSTDAL